MYWLSYWRGGYRTRQARHADTYAPKTRRVEAAMGADGVYEAYFNGSVCQSGSYYFSTPQRFAVTSGAGSSNSLSNRSAIIFLTNLAELQAGRRGNGDGIWLKTRRKGKFGGE